MTELWETFDRRPIPEVEELGRGEFEATYRGRGPVIVRGGANGTRPFTLWDAPYLAKAAGNADVDVATYAADRRDYGAVRHRRMSFAEFLDQLQNGATDDVCYLFNNTSCIFVRNEAQPQFHVGWGSATNTGLAQLAADFELPSFIDPDLFVLAVLIVGSQQNATDLHYDNGGEGKVLVQLRGRKRILLLPPSSARALRLHTMFPEPDSPPGRAGSRPSVDIHGPADGASVDAAGLVGYSAEIGPGDIAYWPPFWFHDLANQDAFNVAAGVMVDEVIVNALLLRHLSQGIYRDLQAAAADEPEATMSELFRTLEQRLLDEAADGTQQLWAWNERFGQR